MTYGAKVSLPGYDVKTCADWQLAYSSEWPLLKIAYQGSIYIPDATVDVTIKTHNLGYVPAFWAFESGNLAGYYGGLKMAYPGCSQYIRINGTDLKWMGGTYFAPAGSVTLRYQIFRYNLATTFTATIDETVASTPGQADTVGILVSKPGKDISSTNLRDFTIRSDCRSPMIHKGGYGTIGVGGGTASITHNLTYEPMYYFWASLADYGDSRYQMVTTAMDSYATATSSTITLYIPYECSYAYMIFKDPMLL